MAENQNPHLPDPDEVEVAIVTKNAEDHAREAPKNFRRDFLVGGSVLATAALIAGGAEISKGGEDTPRQETTTHETYGMSAEQFTKLVEGYETEATEFAKEAASKLPDNTTVKATGTPEHPVYQIEATNTQNPDDASKFIRASIDTPMEGGRVTSATLKVSAEEKGSNGGVAKRVITTFKLGGNSTYLTQDSDGTYVRDFKVAVQEVGPQDISSILVYSDQLPTQAYLDLQQPDKPRLTNGEDEAPLENPPTQDQIHGVMQEVIR